MNITITGNLGSGKTSVCRVLKERGYEIISTGAIFRKIAEERGIDVVELNRLVTENAKVGDTSIDDEIDNRTTKLGTEMDGVVFDSRLAWHFVPESFKVFLMIDLDEAAGRVFRDKERNAEEYESVEAAAAALKQRAGLEDKRFHGLYDIDYFDASNYDFIIDTTNAAPEEIAEEIIRNFEEYQREAFSTRIEICLRDLYPTQEFHTLRQEGLQECAAVETENKTLCSAKEISILECEGYLYLAEEDIVPAAVSLHMGKRFGVIRRLAKAEQISVPSRECLREYETYAGFPYKKYPDRDKSSGFLLEIATGDGK